MTDERLLRNEEIKRDMRREIYQGGIRHEVRVVRSIGLPDLEEAIAPVVCMENGDDPYYQQFFRNRAEVEAFISSLNTAADEAWPR